MDSTFFGELSDLLALLKLATVSVDFVELVDSHVEQLIDPVVPRSRPCWLQWFESDNVAPRIAESISFGHSVIVLYSGPPVVAPSSVAPRRFARARRT